ncbi:MAG: acyl carrier protein [Clostridiales bacterium]|jgi:acyl carrier protein|nr:acyl carrier protein [Clostridiales bacterium]
MLEKIAQILRDYKSDDSLEVTESTTFEAIGLDSLDMVELVMELEDQLEVKIEMDNSVKDIAGLIKLVENSPKS